MIRSAALHRIAHRRGLDPHISGETQAAQIETRWTLARVILVSCGRVGDIHQGAFLGIQNFHERHCYERQEGKCRAPLSRRVTSLAMNSARRQRWRLEEL